jgi:hypothetical protein
MSGINVLSQGAGKIVPLKRKSYLERRPHLFAPTNKMQPATATMGGGGGIRRRSRMQIVAKRVKVTA